MTNGGFATDTDWTKGTGWTINTTTGVASHAAGSSGNLDQSIPLVTGAAYEVRLTLSNVSAGQAQVYLQGSAAENVSAPLNSNGNYSFTLVAGTASSYDFRVNGSSTFVGSIDNISVREAPKIVWAPHNLVTYSEDFSAPGSVNNSNVTLAQGYAEAPDGSMNAERLVGTGTWFRQENYTHTVGQKITVAMWVKSNTGSNQTFRLYGDNNEVSADLTAISTWKWFSHEFTVSTGGSTGDGITRDTSSNDADLLIFGRHSYRSDLGGMHPVPAL